jgi:lipoprotein-anchoring transpeptidase ErfK/SrfK
MSIRRSVIAFVAIVAFALAACSSTGASGAPASGITLPSSLPSLDLQSAAAGLEGFCADFRDKVAAKWPNVDASTAAAIAPLVQQWATKAELSTVKTDVATIGTWVSSMVAGGASATPPPDVTSAFDNIKTFADSNC